MRKALLVLLCACLVPLTLSGAPSSERSQTTSERTSEIPSYLNLESSLPVIKEGHGEDIVLSVAVIRPPSGGDWEDLWVAKYIANFMNLNFDVEQILEAARNERISLMFAAEDVPDILLYLSLTATEIMNYGQINGQLLPLESYINEQLTPNITLWQGKRADAFAAATTPDGHTYTLPYLTPIDEEGSVPRLFINQPWLEASDLETPATLDEFVDMARAFKRQDPGGVGRDKVIPIGGGFEYLNLGWYFLNAMGYVIGAGDSSYGYSPAIRNGECELPVGNEELFLEYLKVMRTCYDEGLISKDFFVLDDTVVIAQLKNDQIGVYGNPVYTTGLETWADWWAAKPLTSKWSSTPVWTKPPGVAVGNFAISADSDYPQTALRFADYYYTELSRIMWIGPKTGSEEAMGLEGVYDCYVKNEYPDGITDIWTYLMQKVTPHPGLGAYHTNEYFKAYCDYVGHPDLAPKIPKQFDLSIADSQYRAGVWENMMPHASPTFPGIYYLDVETTRRMSDLKAVIEPFVQEQVALFIRGDRPLSQFDQFMRELRATGFEEYEQIYKDIWANYTAAL